MSEVQGQLTKDKDDKDPLHKKQQVAVSEALNLKSKAGVASSQSNSLRATVPEGIVAFLNLKSGDKLEWKMDTTDNARSVVVRKITQDSQMAQGSL